MEASHGQNFHCTTNNMPMAKSAAWPCSSVQSLLCRHSVLSFHFSMSPSLCHLLPLLPVSHWSFSQTFLPSSVASFLTLSLLPTPSFIFTPSASLSLPHFCLFLSPPSLCCWQSWPCLWLELFDFTTLSLLCGRYEMTCNNHRSSVMTEHVSCLGSSGMISWALCVFLLL